MMLTNTTTIGCASFPYLQPQNTQSRFDDSLGTPPPVPAWNVGLIATVTVGGTCGVNPVTGQPGFTRNPMGQPGHLRPPINGRGYWGAPRSGNRDGRHHGLDISGVLNVSVVMANRDGIVVAAGPANDLRAGNIVVLQHSGGVVTRYAHLNSVSVQVGQRVTEAQTVGILGNTGNARNAPPHVHFGVTVNGRDTDPEAYLNTSCPP